MTSLGYKLETFFKKKICDHLIIFDNKYDLIDSGSNDECLAPLNVTEHVVLFCVNSASDTLVLSCFKILLPCSCVTYSCHLRSTCNISV